MTKLNLKRVKDYKSLLSKDTRISISTENEMLCVSTVIGEMQNKDTPLTPEEEGGCGGGGMSHLQHLLPVWTPAAPPLLVVWGGVRHTPNRGEVTAASIPTAKSRQELSTTYPRTNKTWWAVSRHCLSHQRGDRLTHAVWRHRYFYPYIIFVSQTPATSENPEDVISEHLIPPRKN